MVNFMKYVIEFAKANDYEDIVKLLHKCFEKENGFFQNLVPVLYKEGKNSYQNHIVVKDNDKIIATIAIKKDIISIDDKYYNFLLLGSLGVDQDYRNQGIMGNLFDFILNKYILNVDFLVLSGSFERYKRFGFFPSAKLEKVIYPKGNSVLFNIEHLKQEDVDFAYKLYNGKKYKVIRDDFFDSLNEWTFAPIIIKRGNEKLGYFIYNGLNNIIEEIVLKDYSIINDVISSFSCMINNELALKLSPSNNEVLPYIDTSLLKVEYYEKTLYRIENKQLKEIYIPRSDII